jgi:metal-responsive CopG/Arc/MetJ family transcriptional regulator
VHIFREQRPITEKEILMRVSVSISELVSNFKEAIKKSIIVKRSEKLLKVFENRQRIHRKY